VCVYSEERKENKQVARKANRGKNKKYSMKILYVCMRLNAKWFIKEKYFNNFADAYEYWTEKVEIREKHTFDINMV